MSKTVTRPIFQFDHGLEGIYDTSDEQVTLPSSVSFGPARLSFSDQIQAMLSPHGIEDFLKGGLAPDIDPALLTPNQFRDTLGQIAGRLESFGPATGRAARSALSVIQADLTLRELLAHYRNALVQG